MTLQYGWLQEHTVWIKGMLHTGYSRTKIYDISKAQGWGIRKTDALETLRFYQGVKEKARSAWKSTPLRYKPSDLKIPRFTGITAKKYLAETTVTRKHIITGEIETTSFRLGMEDMKTRGALEDKIREIGEKAGVKESLPYFDVISIDKVEIFKSQFA